MKSKNLLTDAEVDEIANKSSNQRIDIENIFRIFKREFEIMKSKRYFQNINHRNSINYDYGHMNITP